MPRGGRYIISHPGNLAEEQRALATLGRTYFVHSQSELEKGGEKVTKLLRQASLGYQRSLDVCDKLIGQISDREVLEMKSRLYLNLGLVYEIQSDTREARKFMEKALSIGKWVAGLGLSVVGQIMSIHAQYNVLVVRTYKYLLYLHRTLWNVM